MTKRRPVHAARVGRRRAAAALAGLFAFVCAGSLAAQVQVEAGASREVLSGDREDWEEYWIRATVRPAPGTHAYGGVRHTRRFGQEDQQYEAGGGAPLGERWSVGVDGTWSPTHRVLPRWGADGRLRRALPRGWGLAVGGGRRVYDAARVDRQYVEVDRSFAPFRMAYRLTFHQVDPGGSGVGHGVSGSWSYGPGSSVGLGLGIGRESAVLGPDRIETTRYRSASLGGSHRLDAQTSVTYRFTAVRYDDAFTRTSTSIGIRRGL